MATEASSFAPHVRPPLVPGRPDPLRGLYGPDSEMWRVNREAVLLGAGPAALLLQLAHPLVAEGVAAHSDFVRDPFGRLRRTLRTTLALVFGDGPAAERAIARLNGVHGRVRGEILDPLARRVSGSEAYRALDPQLLLWVQATLVSTSIGAYDRWVAPLPLASRRRLWQEAREAGTRLGIPPELSPPDWLDLEAWFELQIAPGGPVVVTDTARRLSASVLHPPVPYLPRRLMDLALLPGLALLPMRIREGFGIDWSPLHSALAGGLGYGLRGWVRLVPSAWRAMPQARSAERRVRGRTQTAPAPSARSAQRWATIHPPH